jgi:hypothetical protein
MTISSVVHVTKGVLLSISYWGIVFFLLATVEDYFVK